MNENKMNENSAAGESTNNTQQGTNSSQPQENQNSNGWVFSNKNVSDAHTGEQKENGKENVFFHKEQSENQNGGHSSEQPNEEGWYHSGSRKFDNDGSGYNSKYSYSSAPNNNASYDNHANEFQQGAKDSESYKWNYEDYKQEAPKHKQEKNKKSRNKGLRVFTIILCAILCAGVVSLAGYGVYSLVTENTQSANTQTEEDTQAEAKADAQLTLNDKPQVGSQSVSLAEGELTITQRAQKVQPSAVGIVAYTQSAQSIFGGSQSQGSGIIVNKDGYIVTNAHVISGATSVKVVLHDNREYNATIVGSDEKTDLAVLKIEADDLTPAEFGNSDQLEIGEQVITVGNPGGLELAGSITVGYISALNRPITTTGGSTVDCIQTDAAINPGNSGGALVNTYGQVIGINSQKIAATEYEGIGFAISINEAQPIINDLIQYGYVRGRVVMGITMQLIDQTTAQMTGYKPGAGVVSVEANSPAEKAGLVPGDVITEVDGESIVDQKTLSNILEQHKPGDVITLTVYRKSVQSYGDNKELKLKLELAEAGAPTAVQANQQTTDSQNSRGK